MQFTKNSAVSLAALAAIFTAVYAAPATPPDTFTISDDLANQLDTYSKRATDTYTYTLDDALSDDLDLSERDVVAVKSALVTPSH